jgi:hypothetical protein
MSRFAYVAVLPLAIAGLAGCPSNETLSCPPGQFYDSNMGTCVNQGGMGGQCPMGQTWNGQMCVAGGGACPPGQVWNGSMCTAGGGQQCPAGQTWNGQACVAGGGFPNPFGGSSCTPAQPADQMSAAAAGPALNAIAMQQAPGATAVGGVASGNFQPGQCIEVPVTLNPGKCYTAIGTGAGPTEIDVMLAPNLPGPLAQPIAQDNTQGSMAVLGGGANCWKSISPLPLPAKLILKVNAGQGNAAAQLYEK